MLLLLLFFILFSSYALAFNKDENQPVICLALSLGIINSLKGINEAFELNVFSTILFCIAILAYYDVFNRIISLKVGSIEATLKKVSQEFEEEITESVNKNLPQSELNAKAEEFKRITKEIQAQPNTVFKSIAGGLNLIGGTVKLKSSHPDYNNYKNDTFIIIHNGWTSLAFELINIRTGKKLYNTKREELEFLD